MLEEILKPAPLQKERSLSFYQSSLTSAAGEAWGKKNSSGLFFQPYLTDQAVERCEGVIPLFLAKALTVFLCIPFYSMPKCVDLYSSEITEGLFW